MDLWKVVTFIVGIIVEFILTFILSINSTIMIISTIVLVVIVILFLILHKYFPKFFGEKCAYCVLALIFDENLSKVVMVKNKRQKHVLPPGGHVKKGKKLHEEVEKKVFKETGLKCTFTLNRFHDFANDICKTVPQPFAVQIEKQDTFEGHNEHYDFVYIMKVQENESSDIDATEYSAKWYEIDSIKDMVINRQTYPDVYESIKAAKIYLENNIHNTNKEV